MTKYIIAGSNALKYWSQTVIEPKDLDIFYEEETEIPEISSNLRIEYYPFPKTIFNQFITEHNFLTLESLYILKLSHSEYDIHWRKTVQHIQMIKKLLSKKYSVELQDVFNVLPIEYKNLFVSLKNHWKGLHSTKKQYVKLDMPKSEFFGPYVKRKYDHDFIHEMVAYNSEPLYKKCLKNGHEVLLDENKFNALDYDSKIQLCREEIFVIALERFLIPSDFEASEFEAYSKALHRIVTKMTKNWFPTWIVDNYNVLYKFDINYKKKFQQNLLTTQLISLS